ncbi:MAG: VWA domain-containing protein [Kiritimatiellae bacterium]|nr:VWA domain-containing protein [Kiritimatiellia bacterium]
MRFAYPAFLAFAALMPAIGAYFALLAARREKALARLSPVPGGRGSGSAGKAQLFLACAGLALVFFAAARPQWGKSLEKTVAGSRNVVVAIDVSRSMLAADVRPNRLERAKADVADLIDSLDGDRCSIVAFRRTGAALCPLTTDRGFLRSALESLSPDSAPRGETDLGSAIRESLQVISQIDGAGGEKADHSAIIIISDGGDLRGEALKAAEHAKRRGVPIFTVGIGDPSKAAPIPSDDGGNMMFDGKQVTVRLEEKALKEIAEASGGRYVPLATARTAETTLGAIYRSFLRQVAIKEQNEEDERLAEQYLPFLAAGLSLLLAGAALSRGRSAKPTAGEPAARPGAAKLQTAAAI